MKKWDYLCLLFYYWVHLISKHLSLTLNKCWSYFLTASKHCISYLYHDWFNFFLIEITCFCFYVAEKFVVFTWLQNKSSHALGFIVSWISMFPVDFLLDSYTLFFVLSDWRIFCYAVSLWCWGRNMEYLQVLHLWPASQASVEGLACKESRSGEACMRFLMLWTPAFDHLWSRKQIHVFQSNHNALSIADSLWAPKQSVKGPSFLHPCDKILLTTYYVLSRVIDSGNIYT